MADVQETSALIDGLLSGAIKSLQTPIPSIPNYSGTDLSKAKKETERAAGSRDASNAVIDEEKGNYKSAVERQKAALDAEAVAKGDAARADQERAQTIAGIAETIGTEMFGKGDIAKNAAVLAAEIVRLRPEAQRRAAEIDALNNASNPLDWLTNQFILPGKVDAYNAFAAEINGMQNTLDNSLATATAIDAFAIKAVPTITAAQAKAKADLATAEAGKAKAAADEAMAKTNIEFSVRKLASDIAIANQTLDMTKLQQAENHQKYQSQINAINLADTHANRMLRAAQLLETVQKTKGLDVLLQNYDRVMGHPVGTTNRYTFEKFSEARRQDMVAIGAGSLGSDPLTGMMTFYANKPGRDVSPETLRLMTYIREKSDVVAQDMKIQALDEKQKPGAIATKLRTLLNEEVLSASKPGSLFYEITPAAMLASSKIPTGSPIAKLLEPLTKTPGTVPTELVIATLAQNLQNPADAGAAISAYYQANVAMRNEAMNTSLIGLRLPTSYVIQDSLGTLSFTKAKFDLTKPEDATKYILFQRQKEAAKARGTFTSSGGNQVDTSPNMFPNAVRPDNLTGGQ